MSVVYFFHLTSEPFGVIVLVKVKFEIAEETIFGERGTRCFTFRAGEDRGWCAKPRKSGGGGCADTGRKCQEIRSHHKNGENGEGG